MNYRVNEQEVGGASNGNEEQRVVRDVVQGEYRSTCGLSGRLSSPQPILFVESRSLKDRESPRWSSNISHDD